MYKRGQVTIWIIISIVLLILFFVGFFFKSTFLEFLREKHVLSSAVLPKELEPIHSFILNCVRQVGEESLSFVSFYGGYYDLTTVKKNKRGIPYYFNQGILNIPSKNFLEKSLSSYLNDHLKICTSGFKDFNKSFTFEEKKVTSKVSLVSGKVRFDVSYPVKLHKENSIYELTSFALDIPHNLNNIYSAVALAMNEQRTYPDMCLSCLYTSTNLYNLSVQIYNPTLNEVEYSFIDHSQQVMGEPSRFVFALKFNTTL